MAIFSGVNISEMNLSEVLNVFVAFILFPRAKTETTNNTNKNLRITNRHTATQTTTKQL